MIFSVIIPSFGQAQYLKEAILSALSQTFDPIKYEVIVVDDGSVDGSFEIAKQFEPRVRVIKQINKGLAAARNTGIMNAQGTYCFFLDADDVMLPNTLDKIDSWLNPFLDVIAPSIRCFNEDTDEMQDTILKESISIDDFKLGNRLAYCCAIKRSVLLEVGGYSTRHDALGGWEDLSMWYDLLTRGKNFKTIQEPLVMYRVKTNSMWKEAEKNKTALWAQIVKDFPEVKDHVKA